MYCVALALVDPPASRAMSQPRRFEPPNSRIAQGITTRDTVSNIIVDAAKPCPKLLFLNIIS